jgi:hypothetical protein
MPPIQTTYNSEYTAAFAGMVANMETRNVISRTVQDATLAFGVPVFQGALDNSVTATPGTAFRGISIVEKNALPFTMTGGSLAASGMTYQQGDTAGIITKGVVWVLASSVTVAGQQVYLTAGGLYTDVASGDTAIPGALFDDSVASGALVKIRLS